MCIRDSQNTSFFDYYYRKGNDSNNKQDVKMTDSGRTVYGCLLYTSDAADERSSVDLGGRRIIKKKKNKSISGLTPCKRRHWIRQQYTTYTEK